MNELVTFDGPIGYLQTVYNDWHRGGKRPRIARMTVAADLWDALDTQYQANMQYQQPALAPAAHLAFKGIAVLRGDWRGWTHQILLDF